MPRPKKIMPTFFVCFLRQKIYITAPITAKYATRAELLKNDEKRLSSALPAPDRLSSHPVIVVPTLEPSTIVIA